MSKKNEKKVIKLTKTVNVNLLKIPKSKWADIAVSYDKKDWIWLSLQWNKHRVSPERICIGCPSGVAMVSEHMKLIRDKYFNEAVNEKEVAKIEKMYASLKEVPEDVASVLASLKSAKKSTSSNTLALEADEEENKDDKNKSGSNGKNKSKQGNNKK